MTSSTTRPTSSETTGPLRVDNALPSVIGRPHSASGAAATLDPQTVAAATARLINAADNPWAVTTAVRASLERQHGCSPVIRNANGGYSMRVGETPDFEGAIRALALACLPAPTDVILEALVSLRARCAVRDAAEVDMELQAAVYRDDLLPYPADCVLFVLREWPKKSRWWPTWYELHARLEKVAGDRMAIARALPRVQAQWEADHA